MSCGGRNSSSHRCWQGPQFWLHFCHKEGEGSILKNSQYILRVSASISISASIRWAQNSKKFGKLLLGWYRNRNIGRNRYQHKLHFWYKYAPLNAIQISDIKLQFRHLVMEISRDDITQCQPYHKILFGTQHQLYHPISIDIMFQWSPNIPGLVNNDFRSKYSFLFFIFVFFHI